MLLQSTFNWQLIQQTIIAGVPQLSVCKVLLAIATVQRLSQPCKAIYCHAADGVAGHDRCSDNRQTDGDQNTAWDQSMRGKGCCSERSCATDSLLIPTMISFHA